MILSAGPGIREGSEIPKALLQRSARRLQSDD